MRAGATAAGSSMASSGGRLLENRMRQRPRGERLFDACQHANRKRKADEDKAADDRDGAGCDDRSVVIPSAERQARTDENHASRGDNRTQNQQKRIHRPVPSEGRPEALKWHHFDRTVTAAQG